MTPPTDAADDEAPAGEDARRGLHLSDLDLPEPPKRAEPAGIVFRGAERSAPGPAMPYTVNEKSHAWADNVQDLYEKAKARQWNAATDIPWEAARGTDPVLERALAEVLTWMVQQEYAAWYVPARFLPEINPAYGEVGLFLSTQVVDEARHVEVFLKRLHVNGLGLQEAVPSTESSIKGLLQQDDYARASFLLHVLGEGTFKDLFRLLREVAPDEATREIVRRAHEDEARHVAYGVGRLRGQMEAADDPDAVGRSFVDALEQRLSFTYEVSGLPAAIQEALAVLAGGGDGEAARADGRERVAAFVETLDANRRARLEEAGFAPDLVQDISDLHVRSAGGLM